MPNVMAVATNPTQLAVKSCLRLASALVHEVEPSTSCRYSGSNFIVLAPRSKRRRH